MQVRNALLREVMAGCHEKLPMAGSCVTLKGHGLESAVIHKQSGPAEGQGETSGSAVRQLFGLDADVLPLMLSALALVSFSLPQVEGGHT